jgi:hypothetical protein
MKMMVVYQDWLAPYRQLLGTRSLEGAVGGQQIDTQPTRKEG